MRFPMLLFVCLSAVAATNSRLVMISLVYFFFAQATFKAVLTVMFTMIMIKYFRI